MAGPMRTHGTIDGVKFKRLGFSIYEVADEYRLVLDGKVKTVYVLTMKELRRKIAEFSGVFIDGKKDQVQVQPLSRISKAGPGQSDI